MGKDNSPQTSTSTTLQPQYVQNAQQLLSGIGASMTMPFLQTPNFTTAGFTPDQIAAMNQTRDIAGREIQTSPRSPITASGALAPGMSPGTVWASPASTGTATRAGAASTSGSDINALMSPYIQGAISPALANMARIRDNNAAGIQASSAAAGAFGGSREALRQAENDRTYGDQAAQLVGSMYNTGFGQAAGIAQNNSGLEQQANSLNAQLGTNTSLQNAQMRNGVNQFNAQMGNQVGQQNADRMLQGYGLGSQLQTQDLQRDLMASGALGQAGAQQQALAQRNLDTPWTMLDRFRSTVPGGSSSTTTNTAPNNSPGFLQQALPWATLAASFLSDERDKRDIKKLGVGPDGLPLYSYNYKSDPKNAPKRVGPMAQDVEKVAPEAVMNVGGHKVIRGGGMPMDSVGDAEAERVRQSIIQRTMPQTAARLPWTMVR